MVDLKSYYTLYAVEQDILDIWVQTAEKRGCEAADTVVRTLENGFMHICQGGAKEASIQVLSVHHPGVRLLHHEGYCIVYYEENAPFILGVWREDRNEFKPFLQRAA